MGVKEEVLELICKVLDVEANEVKSDEALNGSLGVDSTEMVEILISINKTFGLSLQQGDIANSDSLEKVAQIVESKKQ